MFESKFFEKIGTDGRKNKSYKVQGFVRIMKHFQETGAVARKQNIKNPSKVQVAYGPKQITERVETEALHISPNAGAQ